MRRRSAQVTLLVLFSCASALLLCWFGGYGCSSEAGGDGAGHADADAVVLVASADNRVAAPVAKDLSHGDFVAGASRMIYRGQFEAAEELIEQAGLSDKAEVRLLADIVREYEQIEQRRKEARAAAFREQLAELEKLKASDVLERPDEVVAVDPEVGLEADMGVADANEPNDLPDVLAVIVKANEFADEDQKQELLADPFVQKAMQEAVDRSVLLEAEGKWLDAYTHYFYWLQSIDPNNSGYSDHAEELLDRASIAASFQDSPCESRKERYEGVEKRMFEKAIDALDLHYVNNIDYAEMALKAIRQCDLLAEVLAIAFAEGTEAAKNASIRAPKPEQVTTWSAALAGLRGKVQRAGDNFDKEDFLDIMDEVLALDEATVELPRRALIAHFAEAALQTLDPYTVMVWPRQVQDFEKLMTNEFTGIGIEISKPKGLLTVASLLPDTPAYRSGLDAGDVIEAVDGVPTKDMSLICAVKKITGPKGTKVVLTVRRRGEEPQEIPITRDRIIVPTIRGWQRAAEGDWRYMLDDDERIGYVRITSFSGETAEDLEDVLDALEDDGLRALIIDLRFNTGGLLDSAVDVTNMFVDDGLIVRTQPKPNMIPAYEHARRRGTHPDYPVVVLINSGSASASEIVAGALADEEHERAILVGTRTHGKGSVQGITHYPGNGAQLKYTMAYYHLPSGQRVKSRDEVEEEGREDWGVGPDVEVNLTSEELRQMLDAQRDNDVLVQAHRDEGRAEVNKRTIEETLKIDPQLAVAMLLARTKLIETEAMAAAR